MFRSHPIPWLLGGLLAIVVAIAVIGWVGSWGSTAARLTGPQHTEAQTTAVLEDWTGMQTAACNVIDAGSGGSSNPDDPTLVETPTLAYKATYRRMQQDYNRRMANLFEAYVTEKIPLPGAIHGYPRIAPSLSAMKRQVKQDGSC